MEDLDFEAGYGVGGVGGALEGDGGDGDDIDIDIDVDIEGIMENELDEKDSIDESVDGHRYEFDTEDEFDQTRE